MDEGKPTKAKWWSRPKSASAPDGTGAGAAEAAGRAEDTSGDFTLAAASPPPAEPEGTPPAADPGADPAAETAAEAPPWVPGQADTAPDTPALGTADTPGVTAPGVTAPGVTAPGVTAQAGAVAGASAPDGLAPGTADTPGAPAQGVPAQTGTTPAERPRPLHDPDPYSTPPYGEPGPWAPAPPVQHPAATPAHGTQLPAAHSGTPPHGTPHPQAHPQPTPQPQPQAAPPRQPYDPWNAPLQQSGAVPVDKDKQQKRARRIILVGIAVITLVAGGIGGVLGAYLERNGGGTDIELPQADSKDKARAKDSVAGIAASSLPGVVTLHVSGDEAQGTGTGFVLDGKGHILTNNHVVEPAGTGGEISVTFSGGETAKAEVIGRDSGYDLAVVKVSRVRGLKPLPLGNSENVQVGDPVVAIGAPFDLENTVTSGIISAKERPITAGGEKGDGSDISYVNALQTDAPINPGNSGGPLVDSEARVIGINSAIRSAEDSSAPGGGQAGSIGLGFAIPINQGKRVAEELINTGKATHPVIGVTLDMEYTGDGARVGDKGKDGGPAVNKGGPGDRAGIKPGDVITEVDGRRIHSGDELIVKIRAHRPKDSLELTVQRAGKDRKVTLVLGASSSS
ncbi:trypsin-like peptidase domain-containing protein [Streptomyces sp. NPDC056486]|uniref:trypsin-like peptidase domain-containing protein n=1 Tax=Streptomyces sp. NPDC056486 TaxID=3345835 RepID=UPI0036795AAB